MNIDQLKRNVGQLFRLRPQPRLVQGTAATVSTLTSDGPRFVKDTVKTDYDWLVAAVSSGGLVTLRCDFTGHEVAIGADNVREFRTPNFLLLKGQLILDGSSSRFEPS